MMVKRKIICKRGILKQKGFLSLSVPSRHNRQAPLQYRLLRGSAAILLSHLTYLFYCLLGLELFYGQHLILKWHFFK